jgi:hypothetical protein
MKRILQAMDGVATKPVVGADSMAKFLRVVSEAEINQVPAMPDITGIQPGASKDLGDGSKVTVNQDGTVSYQGGWGTYVYNAQGQHVKTQSPSMAGYSQETDPTGNVTQQNYNQGPMNIQKGPQGTTANYQLGADNLQTTVQENMDTFLSIVKKNDVSILNEGKSPHKVTLPVQMAMQHYQTDQVVERKPRMLDKYFQEAEQAINQRKEEKRELINQYAKVIAERVLIKESKLKNKEDLQAKRKALQDLSLNKDVDQKVVQQRKLDLEKEAKRLKIDEHEAGWDRVGMAGVGAMNNAPDGGHLSLDEMPIEPSGDPNDPNIYGHEKANPMSLKGRIQQARNQLRELAELAESDELVVWERITRLSKGGMFMGLEQNLEQIRHGISELAAKRKRGGVASRGIDKNIGEDNDPCWDSHKMVGTKKKGGKTVPNCVPKE